MGEIKFNVSPGATLEGEIYNSPGLFENILLNNKVGNSVEINVKNLPGNTFTQIKFNIEENQYYISGTVTKDSANVSNAKVYLIDETIDELVGTTVTDNTGNYRFEMLDNKHTYHLAVSWTDELDNKYNAKSKPFIAPTS